MSLSTKAHTEQKHTLAIPNESGSKGSRSTADTQ